MRLSSTVTTSTAAHLNVSLTCGETIYSMHASYARIRYHASLEHRPINMYSIFEFCSYFSAMPFMVSAIFQQTHGRWNNATRRATNDWRHQSLIVAGTSTGASHILPSGHRAKRSARVSEQTAKGKMELWRKYIRVTRSSWYVKINGQPKSTEPDWRKSEVNDSAKYGERSLVTTNDACEFLLIQN